MSVPIVGNKSLSSNECAAKLGPSDSLITSLSWVCLCCLNCCLPGPNIPRATVARATESHKRAKKALDPTQHVSSCAPPDKKGRAQQAGSAPARPFYGPMLGSCQRHRGVLTPGPPPHSSFAPPTPAAPSPLQLTVPWQKDGIVEEVLEDFEKDTVVLLPVLLLRRLLASTA